MDYSAQACNARHKDADFEFKHFGVIGPCRLYAFPDGQRSALARHRLKSLGARGAWRGDADLQLVSREFVDTVLGLALVRAGKVDIVDGLRRFRAVMGELIRFGGSYQGMAGVKEYTALLFADYHLARLTPRTVTAKGEEVWGVFDAEALHRQSGRYARFDMSLHWRMKDGKIAEQQCFFDTASVLICAVASRSTAAVTLLAALRAAADVDPRSRTVTA